MEKWREGLKKQPTRYWSRIEIEAIVKELNIDRNRFYEYSKTNYQKVINRFYYSFLEHKNNSQPSLNYCWLNFRKELKKTCSIPESMGWVNMLISIKENFDYDWSKKLFLILQDGWVYEGYIEEMISILSEIDGLAGGDFYIVTPQYDKFVAYCDDGNCLVFYEK